MKKYTIEMKTPLVSVCMITYNHQNYIPQAIEGVLMQKTNFDLELIIGEDCSTDKTREIVIEYAKKYSNIIKLNLNEKNIGALTNFIKTLNMCRGKYIALCEGDDYWIDPQKLQKQVDFLEANPDFTVCFNRTKIIDEINSISYLDPKNNLQKRVFTTYDLLKRNFMQTPSLVFRNGEYLRQYFEWFKNSKIGDWPLTLTLSLYGNIYYITDVMAVYRKHSGGIHSIKGKNHYAEEAVSIFEPALEYFPNKFNKIIISKLNILYRSLIGYSLRDKDYNKFKLYLNKKKFLFSNNFVYLTSLLKDLGILFYKSLTIFIKEKN